MFKVRHPRGSYIVSSLLSLEVATPEFKLPHLKLSSICKSTSQAVLSRMQLTLHANHQTPHSASRLVQSISVWSVKTRHASSWHCRDARVYGHTTTAIHEIEYISPIEYTPPPRLQEGSKNMYVFTHFFIRVICVANSHSCQGVVLLTHLPDMIRCAGINLLRKAFWCAAWLGAPSSGG